MSEDIYSAAWSGLVGPFATGQVGPLEKRLYNMASDEIL